MKSVDPMGKNEYIRQLKRLLKIYHPDLSGNYMPGGNSLPGNNGLPESMYNEITVKLIDRLNSARLNENNDNKKDLTVPKEQDYQYYRLGIKYYKNIHPNQFYRRNPDTTFETKPYDEQVNALNVIYLSFNLAVYYFKKVIENYPDSPYSDDSKSKIKLLGKLYRSYKNAVLEENKTVNSEKFINEMGLKIL